MRLLIKLTYFRQNGKYYTEGKTEVEVASPMDHWAIIESIKDLFRQGLYPDLVPGDRSHFHTLVEIPYLDGTDDHHKHLIPATKVDA